MGARTVLYGQVWLYLYLYICVLSTIAAAVKCGGPPANGGHPGGRWTGGRAYTLAGGGQGGAIIFIYYRWAYPGTDIHSYCWGKGGYGGSPNATGEGRVRREPQRGGREDVSTILLTVTAVRINSAPHISGVSAYNTAGIIGGPYCMSTI
jgi:hypothetical protein